MSDDEIVQPERAQDSTESAESAESADPGYPPRVCRICLETVVPTLQPSEFLQRPRVVYESEDSGRLLRPCRCKGSSRYVHENCLQTWRHADPRYGARNYWQCPTCGFQYRLQRLTWARWISSAGTQLLLTIAILLFTVFILGFVADPILDLYLGPIDIDVYELEEELNTDSSWIAHLVKGVASLGLLSFIRSIWIFSPFWSPRSGILAGRTTGRDRARSLNWLFIVVGVGTFLWAVYKGVRSWSRRTLEKAGERVMDVPLPEDEDVKTE